jgi:transcriptional regulator with XRE-family HTH domain
MTTADVNARERVRLHLRRLLPERNITGREFAKQLGHGDQWASNLLNGKFALSLDDLDKAARIVKVPTSALVAHPDEQTTLLSPSETRIVNATRALPPAVAHHLIVLAEYLVGVSPKEVDLLKKVRQLGTAERQRIEHWIDVTLLAQDTDKGRSPLDDPTRTIAPLDGSFRPNRRPRGK